MDRIDELTADCFNFLIQFRRTDQNAQPAPDAVWQRVRALIESMQHNAINHRLSQEDIKEISFPIVALADEIAVFYGSPQLRQFWLGRPLQLTLFQTNNAGAEVFDRIEGIRSQILQQGQNRHHVLCVYYMCLVLGFQGKFRNQGEAQLQAIIERLAADLGKANLFGPEQLSAHGERPPGEAVSGTRAALPIVGLAIGAVVIALVFYGALRVSLGSEVTEVLNRISQLVGPQT